MTKEELKQKIIRLMNDYESNDTRDSGYALKDLEEMVSELETYIENKVDAYWQAMDINSIT